MQRFTVFLLLPALIGCSQAPSELVPVTGTVRLDGRPLQEGMIFFESEGASPASGKIVEGRILDVSTHKSNDGLSPGLKMVAVRSADGSTTSPGDYRSAARPVGLGKAVIPERYFDPATSGLTCKIVDGPNELVFTLITESNGPPTAR